MGRAEAVPMSHRSVAHRLSRRGYGDRLGEAPQRPSRAEQAGHWPQPLRAWSWAAAASWTAGAAVRWVAPA